MAVDGMSMMFKALGLDKDEILGQVNAIFAESQQKVAGYYEKLAIIEDKLDIVITMLLRVEARQLKVMLSDDQIDADIRVMTLDDRLKASIKIHEGEKDNG